MRTELFNQKLLKTIEECAANFLVVKQNTNIKCSCVNHSTRQPDPLCKKCLGTGYKVSIKKMRGACHEEMKGGTHLSARGSRITRTYFMDPQYDIQENNYIVDRNEIHYVYRVNTERGLDGVYTHKKVMAVMLQENHDKILKNIMEVLNKKLTAEQKGEFPWLV